MTRRLFLALVLLFVWSATVRAQEPLRVYFFDVGQGDSVLIKSPTGQTVLYDGGDSPAKLVAHLTAVGVNKLDLVIASHNHADHIGGLAEAIRRFSPRFYIDNGVPATTGAYFGVLQAVEEVGVPLLEPTHRQVLLGGGASLTVLPPPGIAGWEQNDNAVGVIVTYGAFRLSLAGDAEQRQWQWWVERYRNLLGHVQVHKASHHGSSNGDVDTVLKGLTPEVVVIGVGANNIYQHPRPEALRLYSASARGIYRTDLNGTVIVEAQSSGEYAVVVERGNGGIRMPSVRATAEVQQP